MVIDDAVVDAVTAHMNGDHAEDNLLIVRAFGHPDATGARMVGLDTAAGVWQVDEPGGAAEVRVPWTVSIAERGDIRRAAVELYRAACHRLGVESREEHKPREENSAEQATPSPGFAQRLRETTWSAHSQSEGADFMADLMRGRGTKDDYAQLVVQHWFLYAELERASVRLTADPALAGLHPPALIRLPALERDLTFLLGTGWQEHVTAVPATAAYVQRIAEVANDGWLAGIVAHHYTRYLGDLSGGQAIARRVASQFGLGEDGVGFYDFTNLGDGAAFKDSYRGILDAFGSGLDDAETTRMLDEVQLAYRFNTEVFVDLDRARREG